MGYIVGKKLSLHIRLGFVMSRGNFPLPGNKNATLLRQNKKIRQKFPRKSIGSHIGKAGVRKERGYDTLKAEADS